MKKHQKIAEDIPHFFAHVPNFRDEISGQQNFFGFCASASAHVVLTPSTSAHHIHV
jgi:hypothetical protein